ncbi:MAG: BUG/TctC family periplasmic protein, partial [uncultured Microvirga sp.]
ERRHRPHGGAVDGRDPEAAGRDRERGRRRRHDRRGARRQGRARRPHAPDPPRGAAGRRVAVQEPRLRHRRRLRARRAGQHRPDGAGLEEGFSRQERQGPVRPTQDKRRQGFGRDRRGRLELAYLRHSSRPIARLQAEFRGLSGHRPGHERHRRRPGRPVVRPVDDGGAPDRGRHGAGARGHLEGAPRRHQERADRGRVGPARLRSHHLARALRPEGHAKRPCGRPARRAAEGARRPDHRGALRGRRHDHLSGRGALARGASEAVPGRDRPHRRPGQGGRRRGAV